MTEKNKIKIEENIIIRMSEYSLRRYIVRRECRCGVSRSLFLYRIRVHFTALF